MKVERTYDYDLQASEVCRLPLPFLQWSLSKTFCQQDKQRVNVFIIMRHVTVFGGCYMVYCYNCFISSRLYIWVVVIYIRSRLTTVPTTSLLNTQWLGLSVSLRRSFCMLLYERLRTFTVSQYYENSLDRFVGRFSCCIFYISYFSFCLLYHPPPPTRPSQRSLSFLLSPVPDSKGLEINKPRAGLIEDLW